MSLKDKDFTPTGIKIDGAYENDRNADSSELFKSIIREVYSCKDVIIAHHLVYVHEDKREDGFAYQIVEEIPSADSLIFDHDVAKKLWGTSWRDVLTSLALEPAKTRDKLLAEYWTNRQPHGVYSAERD